MTSILFVSTEVLITDNTHVQKIFHCCLPTHESKSLLPFELFLSSPPERPIEHPIPCVLRTMSDNKASKSAEEAHLDTRQQQLSSYGSTDPPPAYSAHDETSPTNNAAPTSGFRAGFNALTNAISKTFCGAGSVARPSPDEKLMSEAKTLEGAGGKDKRPNKNCVGCVLHM